MRMQEGGGDAANETERVWGVQGRELGGGGMQIWKKQDGFRAGDSVARKDGMCTEGDGYRSGDEDGKGRAGKRGCR